MTGADLPGLLGRYRSAAEGAEGRILELWLARSRARDRCAAAAARAARLRAETAAAAAGFATAAFVSGFPFLPEPWAGQAAGWLPAAGFAAGLAVRRRLAGGPP